MLLETKKECTLRTEISLRNGIEWWKRFTLDEGFGEIAGSGQTKILQANNLCGLVQLTVYHPRYNLKVITKVCFVSNDDRFPSS